MTSTLLILVLLAGACWAADTLPGMPPVLDSKDIYSADRPGQLSSVVKDYPARVYVPNSLSNSVTLIDPAIYKVIDQFRVVRLPQHVTPSYDLKTLWSRIDNGNSMSRASQATADPCNTTRGIAPYN